MNMYFYKGKNLYGEQIEGLYRAKNKVEVATMIKKNGFFVVDIKKTKGQFINFIKSKLISAKDISIMCRQFSILLKSGIPIIDSLKLLEDQTRNKFVKNAISGIRVQVVNGRSLTKACESYKGVVFPEFFNQMVHIGELTGKLDTTLAKLGDYFDRVDEQKEKIKSSLMYPFILTVVTICVLYFISVNVLPLFINIFKQANVTLPISTRVLVFICTNIKELLILFFISFIILAFTILNIKRTQKGQYLLCQLQLILPIVGNFNRKIIAANFLNYLCMLQSGGVSLLKALNICKKVLHNKIYVEETEKMIEGIKLGRSLSEVINKKLFSNIVINMINIGEETGNLEYMLKQSSIYCEKETNASLDRLLTLVEPFMILLMALIIGFITVAIMLPMFEIYNFIG